MAGTWVTDWQSMLFLAASQCIFGDSAQSAFRGGLSNLEASRLSTRCRGEISKDSRQRTETIGLVGIRSNVVLSLLPGSAHRSTQRGYFLVVSSEIGPSQNRTSSCCPTVRSNTTSIPRGSVCRTVSIGHDWRWPSACTASDAVGAEPSSSGIQKPHLASPSVECAPGNRSPPDRHLHSKLLDVLPRSGRWHSDQSDGARDQWQCDDSVV